MPKPAFKRFGKYEVQAQLGRGGFGTVFRAFDPTVGRLVAIKALTTEARTDLLTRFRNEAMAAGNLRHENIVTIYEFGEDNGVPFIAMEYLEGEDLQQALASGKPLTLLEKLSIMTQAAAGLDCAHRHGVVHRDIKPANIRLLPDGSVKIMDFGIARLTRESTGARLTRRGHVLGTLLYMAPEQVMGAETDALCDIFAFGATFYELLTGRHPFQAEDPRSVFYKITSEDPELIHHLAPNCPEALDHVIRRALHKDRELRYQSLRDLKVDVEPVLISLRKDRATALVAEAGRLVNNRNFEPALALLNQAIDLDSANQAARQVRDSVQVELRRRVIRPRIAALLAKADQSLAEGKHTEALQTLEAALRLDPDDTALQGRAREAQQERDRTREANRLLKEARTDLAEGSLAAALHKASEALLLNPKSAEARSLSEIVQLEMKKRERQLRLSEKLRQARELLLLNSFDDALEAMNALEPEERETPEAAELLARLNAEKAEYERQERLRADLNTARDLLDRANFIEAVQLLQRMRSEFPGEPRIGGLLAYAQQELEAIERAQEIESLQGEVLSRAEAKRFDEAIALVTSALNKYPGESGILRLRDTILLARSAWERRQAVERTVRECESLAETERFDEALAALRETRRIYPDDAALDALQHRLDIERERFLRETGVLDALRASERLVNEGRLEGSAAELEKALAQFPDERLRMALAQTHDAIEVKRRAAMLEQMERDVRNHIGKHEFDRALLALDRAPAAVAGDALLTRIREETLSAKRAWEKSEAIAAAQKAARALQAEQRFEEALETALACQARFPDDSALARLAADLQMEIERRDRVLAVQDILDEEESLAARGDHAAAAELMRGAADRFPDESAVAERLASAEWALRKWQRDQAIDAARKEARDFAARQEFGRALDVVADVARAWPGQPEIESLREEIRAAQAAKQRERDIALAEQKTLALCAEGRFAEAIGVAGDALVAFPGESTLLKAEVAAQEGWAQQRRAEKLQSAIHDAEARLSDGDAKNAVDVLRGAQARYGASDAIQTVLERAEQALRAELRARAIASAVAEADRLIARGRADRALSTLEGARSEHGESPEIEHALDRAREAVKSQQREQRLIEAAKTVRAHLASHDFDAAAAAADTAQRDVPHEPRLQELRAEISAARADWIRRQQIAASVQECERLCAREKFEEARKAADAALRIHPDAPELGAARRAAEIGKCAADAAEFTSAGEPAMAVELLGGAISRLGTDARLAAALAEAEAAIKARRRAEAMAAAVESARRTAAQGRFDESLALLDAAEREWGADEAIARARESVVAEREAAERERARRAQATRDVIEQARRMMERDDPAAAIVTLEAALREYGGVAELQAALDGAREAEQRSKVERERRAAIQPVLRQCSDLITAGSLADAGKALRSALRSFPDEPELLALQETLKAEWDRQRRTEATRRAADNARALLEQGQPARAIQLLEAAAAQYPDDQVVRDALAVARKAQVDSVCKETRVYLGQNQFDMALKTVEMNLETMTGEPRLVELRQTVMTARRKHQREASKKRASAVAQAVTDDVPIPLPTREVEVAPAPPAALPAQPPARRSPKVALVAAGVILALGGAVMGMRALRPTSALPVLLVESQPAGAVVKIGDRSCITPECRLELPAGNYTVEAQLAGYAAATEAVSILAKADARIQLMLRPLPTSLTVTSNFTKGTVYLDDAPAGELKDGQLTMASIQPGAHRVKITSPDGEASLALKVKVAAAPQLNGEIAARDADAIVVVSMGSSMRVACSGCRGSLTLDGKPLDGKAATSGAHELKATAAGGRIQSALYRAADAPAIAIHLSSAASSSGTLVVETNVDGASVSIDRRKLEGRTEAGRLAVPLEPRDYRIEVRKQGYRVTPERMTAKIRRGDQFRAAFRLEPYPGSVAISGAPDGAAVQIDGAAGGIVRGGGFTANVAPGTHTVTLAKDGFKSTSIQRSFEPGETVRLDSASLRMELLPQQPQQPKPLPPPPVETTKPIQPSAETLEAGEWAAARAGRDPAAIQAFLQKHPESARRQEAQQLLTQLEWDGLDRNDRSALDRFAARHRGTPLAQQAAAEIARLDRESAASASKAAEQKLAADRNEISSVFATYSTAFEKKDLALLKTVWPNLPESNLSQAFHGKGEIHSQLRPLAAPELSGNQASVRCTRVTQQVTQFGRQKPFEETRTVRLRRDNGRWVIYAID
jgi:serine/threonine-protein kinase